MSGPTESKQDQMVRLLRMILRHYDEGPLNEHQRVELDVLCSEIGSRRSGNAGIATETSLRTARLWAYGALSLRDVALEGKRSGPAHEFHNLVIEVEIINYAVVDPILEEGFRRFFHEHPLPRPEMP